MFGIEGCLFVRAMLVFHCFFCAMVQNNQESQFKYWPLVCSCLLSLVFTQFDKSRSTNNQVYRSTGMILKHGKYVNKIVCITGIKTRMITNFSVLYQHLPSLCLHHSLISFLRTARVACTLHCAHFFAHSLTPLFP